MTHLDPDTLVAYSLATLKGEELRETEAHINECEQCRLEAGAHLEALAALTTSRPATPVPADWEDDLIARIGGSPARQPRLRERAPLRRRPVAGRPWQRWLPAALAVLVLAVVALPAYRALEGARENAYIVSLLRQPGATARPLVNAAGVATGVVVATPAGHRVVVLNSPPPAGKVYQAWHITPGKFESIGLSASRVLEVAVSIPEGSLMGVSTEPPGGSKGPTSKPVGRVKL